ncbi:MAG TPA: ABC transporter permease [Puia sp.]|nr:ABC transporter permease [Puia sp.]
MLKNYFKTAWRNLTRNKAFSFINIFGLGLGMACSLLIFLWVRDERSVDLFNAHKDIYDVYETVFSEGRTETSAAAPGMLAVELKRTVPDIEYASAFWNDNAETLLTVGNKDISMNGSHADSDFFKMFSYPLLQGTAQSALAGPDDMAVSRRLAEAFFGSSAAAFGKTLRVNNQRDFKINAVFENVPANASQQFDFVINWADELKTVGWLYDWINRSPSTFVRLKPGADPVKVAARIKNFVMPYIASAHYGAGNRVELGLQRYEEMYLHSTFKNGAPAGGRIEYVRLLSLVALFILLIACINFMNLATARSVKRAKEVGIRKAVGALRLRLIVQFIGEAMLLTFFAGIVCLALVILVLPYFNAITGKQIIFPFASPSFWIGIAFLLCLTGLVAGSYPALFLSSLNPVRVLKGALTFGPGALLFRKGLVVFQFVLSIVMITGTIVISRQIHYVQTANLGFDKDNLVCIPFRGELGHRYQVFKQQLAGMPGIKAVGITAQAPSHIGAHVYDLDWAGRNPDTKVISLHNGIGYDYPQMMGLQLVKGRFFSRAYPSDTSHSNPNLVINETLAKMIGFKDPLGQRLRYFGSMGTIIGVVKDFHLKSLHDPIEPVVLYWGEDLDHGFVLVKTGAGKTQQAIADMERVFKQLEPKFPFRYFFADEEYQKLYNSELTVSKLSDSFSFLAIFISCLGLLGLTMFTAEQRRKEIGVRKVIGASVGDIVVLLFQDIIKLVAISTVIATPLAWLVMNDWLQNFAYRITVSWWIFLVAGLVAVAIALGTISWQAIKAALANPVKSLKTE